MNHAAFASTHQTGMGGYVSHFEKNVFPWRHLVPGDSGQR